MKLKVKKLLSFGLEGTPLKSGKSKKLFLFGKSAASLFLSLTMSFSLLSGMNIPERWNAGYGKGKTIGGKGGVS